MLTANEQDGPVASDVKDKERFDHGIAMMKAYYDALEGRLVTTAGLFVGVAGWLIASEASRKAVRDHTTLMALAVVTLTSLLILYAANVAWWVRRWTEIRKSVDRLGYLEPEFYARYDLPKYGWAGYVVPVAMLYLFIVAFLVLIARDAS